MSPLLLDALGESIPSQLCLVPPSEAPKKPMQSMWFKKKHPIEIHNSLDYLTKEKKTFFNNVHKTRALKNTLQKGKEKACESEKEWYFCTRIKADVLC